MVVEVIKGQTRDKNSKGSEMLLESSSNVSLVCDRKKYRSVVNTNLNGTGEMSLMNIQIQITPDIINVSEVFVDVFRTDDYHYNI